MRVVTYTDSEGIGGAEISLGHLVAQVSDSIAVTVMGTSKQVVDAIASRRPQAARVVVTPNHPWSFAAHYAALYRLRPDIVHLNLCTPWQGATGLFAALLLPNTRVVRVDQLPLRTTDPTTLLRTRMLSLRVDAHVAVGQASARQIEDFYALGRNTVISIPNGVPDIVPPQPPQPKHEIVVGSVGRLDAMKAHDVLLRALAKVEKVQVVILGEGGQRQVLEQLAQKLGISDRLSMPGWVDNPRSYLANFDMFVLPSRSEGFPLAIVEAMLAARPVIATRVGSVSEAVIDGETGILIDQDDVDELASAIYRLRDDPELRWRFGQSGREVAVKNFSAEVMATKYERLWYEVTTTASRSRLIVPRPLD
ncbi:glycosyltransferase family 4 protein [Gloeocapsopsis crepidinum LEGE 06123]|uniref:Glycosyltransferase family 4 protein n=1 Tax=Gloeocapsopsis crepidinum LEGE 06123 TaxID=588587 RepID=A0ABR9URY4_9CHRO|nr:glycosyltransferase family 4 protein [Gloeocapsopsis crepidinum LEGE 06123]